MGKKKRNFILIALLSIFVIAVLVIPPFMASVSVKNCDKQAVWGDYEAYEYGYNSHGIQIFKHHKKALEQFKKDYAEGFQYLREVRGFPELLANSSYKVVNQYSHIAFGPVRENIENREEIENQVYKIISFMDTYENSYWQYYAPFY